LVFPWLRERARFSGVFIPLVVGRHPWKYSDEFTPLLKRAGLPKIQLHDSRHTTLSLMAKAGIPVPIISK
jgi:hypothetical protein